MTEQSWLQSLGLDTIQRALIPLGTAAGAVWTAWKFSAERQDKREIVVETREEQQRRELDERQAAMSKRDAEAMVWVRDEAERYRKRLIEVEAERDEAYHSADAAWDIARAWKERSHQIKHDLDNARTMVNAALIQRGTEPRAWPDEQLPPLDEILEDNARRLVERRSNLRAAD